MPRENDRYRLTRKISLKIRDLEESSSRIPIVFAIRLTEQISSIGLFAVTESQCTEDEHDDEDEDDSKFRNLG
jgi:hypothetical protein